MHLKSCRLGWSKRLQKLFFLLHKHYYKPLRAVFALKVFRTNLVFCHILPNLSRNLCKLSIKPAKKKQKFVLNNWQITVKFGGRTVQAVDERQRKTKKNVFSLFNLEIA